MTETSRTTDPTADNPGGADAEAPARARPARAVRPRNAASLILWRGRPDAPEVLMGHRHARHRFMPSVMVFPGGAVDPGDHRAKAGSELRPEPRRMLEHKARASLARALAIAAARELFEETGLVLGERRGDGIAPDLAALDYLCRAVTPATRPIRFNARFLIARAEAVQGDIAGSGELEDLQWYPLERTATLNIAPITGKVLVEFRAWLAMREEERATRPLIVFRGNDNRTVDR